MLITTTALCAWAHPSDAQGALDRRISAEGRNVLLKDALSRVADAGKVNISYAGNSIFKTARVSFNAHNQPLKEVLDGLLNGFPLQYGWKNEKVIIWYSSSPAQAPQLQAAPAPPAADPVKGTVRAPSGEALIGVSVQVKGTKRGTVTDPKGEFSIEAGTSDMLVISYIGYEKMEVPVNGSARLDVTLKPSESGLNELVVLGYGQKQTRLSMTGAVSSIQTKELKQSPVANISNALAGRLPGLIAAQRSGRPGSDASNLYIRGISTFNGSTSPLVVIDGLPRGDANFGDIDPNEIESVSILKDASSTALYGIQGANGIVLITTKRGKEAAPNIQVNTQYALQQPARRTRYLDSYTSGLLQNEAAKNDDMDPVFSERDLELYKGQLKPGLYPNVDWFDYLIRDHTPQKQANINISGGSKYVRYFVSGSYLRQEPVYRHADENIYGVKYKYDRYNFRSNVDITLDKNLDLQVDLASRLENRSGPANDKGDGNYFFILLSQLGNGVTPVHNPDGSLAAGGLPNGYANPYGVLTRNGYFDDFWHSTNGNIAVTRKLDFITPGLRVKGLFSFENYGSINFTQNQEFNSFRYSEDQLTGAPIYTRFSTGNSMSRSGGTSGERYLYYDLKLLYDRTFGKHTLGGLFLFNRNYRSQSGDLPRVYQGFVGRVAYDYAKKYFLEFNTGFNGSENFPPGARYGFFPAVSAGWLLSEEPWMQDWKALNFLKLRASHGYVGNDLINGGRWMFISDYKPKDGYVFGSTPGWVEGYGENRVGNTAITWERAAKSNFGLEAGFLKNSIRMSVDVFQEERSRILTNARTIPGHVGIAAAISRNRGKARNRGVEAELTYNGHIGKVSVFTRANYTYTKNKILDMDEPVLQYPWQSAVGGPIGYDLGYISEGLFQSEDEIAKSPLQRFSSKVIPGDIKYRDINGDNIIDETDRVMIPVLNVPNSVWGATFGMGYKGFDVSVLFQGAAGGRQQYSGQIVNAYRLGFRPHHLGRWTPENAADATYPALHLQESNAANNSMSSTYWARNTDYIKLKNLELGYQFPVRWIKWAGLKTARLYFSGMNLISWDHVKDLGIDPESNTAGRYGWQPYPVQRIYNAGLTVNF